MMHTRSSSNRKRREKGRKRRVKQTHLWTVESVGKAFHLLANKLPGQETLEKYIITGKAFKKHDHRLNNTRAVEGKGRADYPLQKVPKVLCGAFFLTLRIPVIPLLTGGQKTLLLCMSSRLVSLPLP